MLPFFLLLLPFALQAQPKDVPLDASSLQAVNVQVENVTWQGRSAVRVSDTGAAGDGHLLALIPSSSFREGVIELELAGAPQPGVAGGARGFVGIAFRVQHGHETYSAFYLRPTNGRADDQVRRNHSTQYIAHPAWTWNRLRQEFPKMYESYVDLVPGEWTRVRIEVRSGRARLFVHGTAQPCLIVNDMKQDLPAGAIALWIGPGTVAHFTGLRVSP